MTLCYRKVTKYSCQGVNKVKLSEIESHVVVSGALLQHVNMWSVDSGPQDSKLVIEHVELKPSS